MSVRVNALVVLGAVLLSASSQAASTVTTIGSWDGSTGYVSGRPFVAPSGVVYGALGNNAYDPAGSIYALTPPQAGSTTWTQATISTFSGGASGGFPVGGLINDPAADSSGDLYGAAYTGGTSSTCSSLYTGCGVIYQLTPPNSGSTWTRNVLYTFQGGTDGSFPVGDLVADSTGALYGATQYGGCTPASPYYSGCGTIFKLTPPTGGGGWTETVLYRFKGGTTDGVYPGGRLLLDASGNIYGTTLFGGTVDCTNTASAFQITDPDGGCGVVFKLTKSGSSYTESILHFFTDGKNGSVPAPGLVMDTAGNIYGSAVQGGNTKYGCNQYGQSGCGLVFELVKPAKGAWKETTLFRFAGKDGGFPTGLLIDAAGKLAGENSYNTTSDTTCPASVGFYCGTAFEVELSKGKWKQSELHAFADGADNAGPEFGLAVDSAGVLYGVTEAGSTSTVFTLTGTGFVPGVR